MKVKVSEGGSVLLGGVLQRPGAILDVSPKQADEFCKSGYATPADQRDKEKDPNALAPGVDVKGINAEGKIVKPDAIKMKSNWTLDPAGLQSKTMEQLNAMIIERDAAIAPYSTKEEAIGQLSMDFGV